MPVCVWSFTAGILHGDVGECFGRFVHADGDERRQVRCGLLPGVLAQRMSHSGPGPPRHRRRVVHRRRRRPSCHRLRPADTEQPR